MEYYQVIVNGVVAFIVVGFFYSLNLELDWMPLALSCL